MLYLYVKHVVFVANTFYTRVLAPLGLYDNCLYSDDL